MRALLVALFLWPAWAIAQPVNTQVVGCLYRATPGTVADNQYQTVLCDANGRVVTSSASGGTTASTVADGADVAEGSRADSQATNATGSWSVIALLKGIYTALLAPTPAGTNNIGIVTAQAGTSNTSAGSLSTSRIQSSAATTNAVALWGAQVRLYKIRGYNASTSVRHLKIYNKASNPTVGSDVPLMTFALPPQAAFSFDWADIGYYLSTGLSIAITQGAADSDTVAVAAGDILGLNLDYRT